MKAIASWTEGSRFSENGRTPNRRNPRNPGFVGFVGVAPRCF